MSSAFDIPQFVPAIYSPSSQVGLSSYQNDGFLSDVPRAWVWVQQPIYEQPKPTIEASTENLRVVRLDYALTCPDKLIVEALAASPGSVAVLREAVPHLRKAFGQTVILQLEAFESDEGYILRGVAQMTAEAEFPEAVLDTFKSEWWLANCHRGGASLVFDYEVANALRLA
jgi:hypothetical protein